MAPQIIIIFLSFGLYLIPVYSCAILTTSVEPLIEIDIDGEEEGDKCGNLVLEDTTGTFDFFDKAYDVLFEFDSSTNVSTKCSFPDRGNRKRYADMCDKIIAKVLHLTTVLDCKIQYVSESSLSSKETVRFTNTAGEVTYLHVKLAVILFVAENCVDMNQKTTTGKYMALIMRSYFWSVQKLEKIIAKELSLAEEGFVVRGNQSLTIDKIIDNVQGHVENGQVQKAVGELIKLGGGATTSYQVHIPPIITSVFAKHSGRLTVHILNFILQLPYFQDEVLGYEQLYKLLAITEDYNRHIILFNDALEHSFGNPKFQSLKSDIRKRYFVLKCFISTKVDRQLASFGEHIRNRKELTRVLNWVDNYGDGNSELYFQSIIKHAYKKNIQNIEPILSFIRRTKGWESHISLMEQLMKEVQGNEYDMYKREAFTLIHEIILLDKTKQIEKNETLRTRVDMLGENIPSSMSFFLRKSFCYLRNTCSEGYLEAESAAMAYDKDRRNVVLKEQHNNHNISSRWIFEYDAERGTFDIKNLSWGEYLYAASGGFKEDEDQRPVFTWRPGAKVIQGVWIIEPQRNGKAFKLLNKAHKEYLYGCETPTTLTSAPWLIPVSTISKKWFGIEWQFECESMMA